MDVNILSLNSLSSLIVSHPWLCDNVTYATNSDRKLLCGANINNHPLQCLSLGLVICKCISSTYGALSSDDFNLGILMITDVKGNFYWKYRNKTRFKARGWFEFIMKCLEQYHGWWILKPNDPILASVADRNPFLCIQNDILNSSSRSVGQISFGSDIQCHHYLHANGKFYPLRHFMHFIQEHAGHYDLLFQICWLPVIANGVFGIADIQNATSHITMFME